MEKLQKSVTLNPVNNLDNYLSIQALPKTEKEKIIRYYDTFECSKAIKTRLQKEILTPMIMEDYSSTNPSFFQRTEILDKVRGESFVEVYPQYEEWKDFYTKAYEIITDFIKLERNIQ